MKKVIKQSMSILLVVVLLLGSFQLTFASDEIEETTVEEVVDMAAEETAEEAVEEVVEEDVEESAEVVVEETPEVIEESAETEETVEPDAMAKEVVEKVVAKAKKAPVLEETSQSAALVGKGEGEKVGYHHVKGNAFKTVFELDENGSKVEGSDEYVYCVEDGREPTSTISSAKFPNIRYRSVVADGDLNDCLLAYAADHAQPVTNYEYRMEEWMGLKDALAKVLYNGFPHDASGLGAEFSSEQDFYSATQNAVYWTLYFGKADVNSYAGTNYKKGGADKILKATATPDSYTMYIYKPDPADSVSKLQRLINCEFSSKPKEPTITNTTAKGNGAAGEVQINAGEEVTLSDDVEFAGLEEGKTYSITSYVYKDGEEFDSKTTKNVTSETTSPINVVFDKKLTEGGKYAIKTDLLLDNEVVFTHNKELEESSEIVTVVIKKYPVKVSKQDINNSEELPGAALTITNEKGETMDEWTSGSEFHEVELPAGKYVLTETTAPNGYKIAESIDFTVEADGSVTSEATVDGIVVMKDARKVPVLRTTVSANGKASSDEEAVRLSHKEAQKKVAVVDTIAYENLLAGVSYHVDGTLVEVDDKGKIVNDNVATAEGDFVAETENGTWELDFGEVQLKSGSKYVVFESAYAPGGEDSVATEEKPVKHENVDDLAQTIVTENEDGEVRGDTEEPKNSNKNASSKSNSAAKASTVGAVKTGDTSNAALWTMLFAVSAILCAHAWKRRKER